MISVYSKNLSKDHSDYLHIIRESIYGIRDIIISGTYDAFFDIYKKVSTSLKKTQTSVSIMLHSTEYVLEGVMLCILLSLFYYQYITHKDPVTIVAVIATMVVAIQRIRPYVQKIYNAWSIMSVHQNSVLDTFQIFNYQQDISYKREDIVFNKYIEIKDLSFKYENKIDNKAKLLNNVNFVFNKGERIGIMGITGSGKSTFIDLIMGLESPTEGDIYIDGNILKLDNRSWYDQLAHISQSTFLLNASFTRNISFAGRNSKVIESKVIEAATMSHANQFIENRQDGYESVIGHNGLKLSSGERQRIGIARAVYQLITSERHVIVLDEATNALDNTTERKVLDNLFNFGRKYTIFIVSHNLELLERCDKIIEVKQGKAFFKSY